MKEQDHAIDALRPRFGLVLESGVEAEFARDVIEDISETARIEALKQFGPGSMILAHVHDGKRWSKDQMVIWRQPDGEFGR